MSEQKTAIAAGERIGLEGRSLQVLSRDGSVIRNTRKAIAVRNEVTGRLSYIPEWRLLKGYRHNMPVVSPGDLRARIEQLKAKHSPHHDGPTRVYTHGWNEAIAEVLALLGAAQEKP